ncbi:hypothetical protein [Mannheimia pernigra]|uniref:hypothetical protein n=1 Tax=Mannheimia pernigra TaxID=111844 RepID=UPI001317A709|nr:hypothetical protein [Mannheimia pernigra]QHB16979.1 hypothetical protein GM695_02390 [Mannheimia pernigra]
MADVKTHLRELSFCLQIGILKNQLKVDIAKLSPTDFFDLSKKIITNDIDSARNIIIPNFDNEHQKIILNGVRLANAIFDNSHFSITSFDQIYWLGNDTQKSDLIDIQVGIYGFSLKEESFILENMGLYKFINLLTNSNYERGLHVFMEFAKDEYEEWFAYTWQLLNNSISQNRFLYNKKEKYISKIEINNNLISFSFQSAHKNLVIELPNIHITWSEFMYKLGDKDIREKVFCKWVSEVASRDQMYIDLKSHCSETAGRKLVNYLINNLSDNGLARFLQIYNSPYFYAKVTNNDVKVFKVPSLSEFADQINIDDVIYSVPKSQLNILTTIKNKSTNKSIVLRNECRFSHGQFNGTPEAKMYYDKKSNLADIYIPIL